jgi:hypothetical protein
MKDEAPNPFSQHFSMTSLERTLTNMENGSGGSSFDRLSSRKKREIIIRGVLSVTVISGEDLPAMDMNGKSDPYVILSLKKTKTKYKTRVISSSNTNYLVLCTYLCLNMLSQFILCTTKVNISLVSYILCLILFIFGSVENHNNAMVRNCLGKVFNCPYDVTDHRL